jgi:hypothetical protein
LEKKEQLAPLEFLATKDHKAHKELKVNVEQLALLEKKDHKALKEFKAHKVNVVQLVLLVQLENLVL